MHWSVCSKSCLSGGLSLSLSLSILLTCVTTHLNTRVAVVVLHPRERRERGGQKNASDRHTRAITSNLHSDDIVHVIKIALYYTLWWILVAYMHTYMSG